MRPVVAQCKWIVGLLAFVALSAPLQAAAGGPPVRSDTAAAAMVSLEAKKNCGRCEEMIEEKGPLARLSECTAK